MDANKKKNLILLGGAGTVFAFLLIFLLGDSKKSSGKGSMNDGSIFTAIPEAETQELNESKSDIYLSKSRVERDNEKYFSGLDKNTMTDSSDISLVINANNASQTTEGEDKARDVMASLFQSQPSAEPVQPRQPSTRTGGSGGFRTSSSINQKSNAKSVSEMTADERMDYDRKRAEMMRDVLLGESGQDKASEQEEEQRISEFRSSTQRSGIISSLDEDGYSDGNGWTESQTPDEDLPVRCIFVRDEKLKNGQRVTVRLLEDYEIGGVRIPVNTHLSATCTIGNRLTLKVTNVEIDGRIIPLNLDAYDRDGSLGIYCPETGSTRNQNTVTNNALSTATSTIGGMVGRIAGAAVNTGAAVVRNATGDISVSISSGYEFYLMKSKRR